MHSHCRAAQTTVASTVVLHVILFVILGAAPYLVCRTELPLTLLLLSSPFMYNTQALFRPLPLQDRAAGPALLRALAAARLPAGQPHHGARGRL